jgi:hypothetical protein
LCDLKTTTEQSPQIDPSQVYISSIHLSASRSDLIHTITSSINYVKSTSDAFKKHFAADDAEIYVSCTFLLRQISFFAVGVCFQAQLGDNLGEKPC